MSPSVELSPQTFARLQKLAVPLIDTIDSVVSSLLDTRDLLESRVIAEIEDIKIFNPDSPPDLTHTRVINIQYAGQTLTNWDGLLRAAVQEARVETSYDDEKFKTIMTIPWVVGSRTTEGYCNATALGISFQGQDAKSAWKASSLIARKLGHALEATFTWRDKPGAAYPGVTGRMTIPARR